MNIKNTPMSRVSCCNDENPENQADQFRTFFFSFGHLTLGMGVHGKSGLLGFKKKYGGS